MLLLFALALALDIHGVPSGSVHFLLQCQYFFFVLLLCISLHDILVSRLSCVGFEWENLAGCR